MKGTAITVGFIGLGTMGAPMVRNLMRAGFSLRVFDVLSERTREAAVDGAQLATSPRDAAQGSKFIVTMVPDSPHVEEALLSDEGALKGASRGAVLIDMSTISPKTCEKLAGKAQAAGAAFLDAPVSGGQKGAKEGALSIMVGGDKKAFEESLPVFNALGKTVRYVGKTGMGQVVKLCNQIVCAMNLQAISEAFVFAEKAGVELETLREVLLGGSASSWMLDHLGPQMIAGDDSAGFRIDLQLKDLRLANEAGFEMGIPLPGAGLVTNLYLNARACGEGGNGNQALIEVYRRLANLTEGRKGRAV